MSFNEWNSYNLDEVYDFASGLSKSRKEFGFGYPFVTFKDVFYNFFIPEKLTELANTSEKERMRCSVKRGDVFLTRTSETMDELGKSSVALKDYPEATFNGFTKRLRPNGKVNVYPEYAGYYFRSPRFRAEINSMATMTTRASLNNEMMSRLKIILPKKEEQEVIAKILLDLDKKIEINNKINKKLEEMAQTIFKHWFVDFEFPNEEGEPYKSSGGEMVESEIGMVPRGWNISRINDLSVIVTDYVANGSFKSLKDNVNIYDDENYALFMRNSDLKCNFQSGKKYVDKHSYDFLSKTKLFGGELIISNVGDVGSVYLCPYFSTPMTLGNNVIMVNSKVNVNYNYFLYRLFKSHEGQGLIDSITGGSAQPKFNKTDFRSLKLILPEGEKLIAYNNIVWIMEKKILDNNYENDKLSMLRGILLPKLMSGEIRVPIELKEN